jgi:transcriptional regulator with XRE-family HTH domain
MLYEMCDMAIARLARDAPKRWRWEGMDDQARAIGRRVRYWRLRRNLGRQRFADMVGRSTSWLDKVEKGERSLLRLPMLDRVATALDIDVSVLTDSSAAQRAADCVDTIEVQAIKAALGRYAVFDISNNSGRQVLFRQAIAGQLAYVEHAWSSSHFTVVARHLPRLLTDTQLFAVTASAADQITAHRMLVITYRLASSMLMKFDANDIAWLAADRAMQTALAIDDTVALARATRSVARAMSRSGQRTAAVTALIGMADRIRPELADREHELLSLFGMLFLAASITAAAQDDAALALEMHEEAREAADRMGPHHDTHRTVFGRANVAVHRVAALVRVHEGGRALEYSHRIAPTLIDTLTPERKASYLLDLAQAYTHVGHYDDATRSLAQAEHVAPEEVHCRPLAHGLLRSLLDTTSGESSRTLRQIAARAGVTA